MKNITKFKPQKYEIRFSYLDDLTGKRRRVRRRIYGDLHDAVAERDRLRALAHDGRLGRSEVDGDVTVGDLVDEWRRTRKVRPGRKGKAVAPSTYEKDESVLECHVLPEIEDWRLHAVELHDLDGLTNRWATKRKKNGGMYSSVTVNNWIKVTKVLMRWCFRRIGRPTHILDDWTKLPVDQCKAGRVLEPDEARAFLAEMQAEHPQWYALTFTLLATGQRFSSVSALEWADVDFEHDVITFARSQYRGQVRQGNKTGKIVRLPLTDALADVLQWHRRRLLEQQHPGVAAGLVFPARVDPASAANNGYLGSASCLRKPFLAVVDELDLEHLTPHDLRRTFNSWAVERAPGTVVRSISGHSKEAMTDHYYHGSREAKAEVLTAVTGLVT